MSSNPCSVCIPTCCWHMSQGLLSSLHPPQPPPPPTPTTTTSHPTALAALLSTPHAAAGGGGTGHLQHPVHHHHPLQRARLWAGSGGRCAQQRQPGRHGALDRSCCCWHHGSGCAHWVPAVLGWQLRPAVLPHAAGTCQQYLIPVPAQLLLPPTHPHWRTALDREIAQELKLFQGAAILCQTGRVIVLGIAAFVAPVDPATIRTLQQATWSQAQAADLLMQQLCLLFTVP